MKLFIAFLFTFALGAQPPTLQSIAVTPAGTAVVAGSTVQLTVTGNYSGGYNDVPLAPGLAYFASNATSIATVSPTGLVTGITPGATFVIVLSGTTSALVPISVIPVDAAGPPISARPSTVGLLTYLGTVIPDIILNLYRGNDGYMHLSLGGQ